MVTPVVLSRSLDQSNKFWSLARWKRSSNAPTRPSTALQLPCSPRIWTRPCISLKDFAPELSGIFPVKKYLLHPRVRNKLFSSFFPLCADQDQLLRRFGSANTFRRLQNVGYRPWVGRIWPPGLHGSQKRHRQDAPEEQLNVFSEKWLVEGVICWAMFYCFPFNCCLGGWNLWAQYIYLSLSLYYLRMVLGGKKRIFCLSSDVFGGVRAEEESLVVMNRIKGTMNGLGRR